MNLDAVDIGTIAYAFASLCALIVLLYLRKTNKI